MDKNDESPRTSPIIDVDTFGKEVVCDNAMDNKSSKFLSIDDILVRDKVGSRSDMTIHHSKNCVRKLETQYQRETSSASESDTEIKNSFQHRPSENLSSYDDVLYSQDPVPSFQLDAVVHNQLSSHDIPRNLKDHVTRCRFDKKNEGLTSENYDKHPALGETPNGWWVHPLWKQLYEARVPQESQTNFTKFLLPSYLMISQQVLGSRLSFQPLPAESVSDSRALTTVLNVDRGDTSKDSFYTEKTIGQDVHNAESTKEEASAAVPNPAPSKPRRRRQRQAYTITQLNTLEEEFKNNRYLSSEKRESMSQALGLSENQVKAWFQNRRTKHKKQLTQHISQLGTSHQANNRDDRQINQIFNDPGSFVFPTAQHPFTSLPMVPPLQLHELTSFLNRGYSSSTSYLSLLQKMI